MSLANVIGSSQPAGATNPIHVMPVDASGNPSGGGTFVVPQTSGGLAVKQMTSSDGSTPLTNVAQAIKASAGQLYGWSVFNPNAAVIYVAIFDIAAATVVVGTTPPKMTLCMPASGVTNIMSSIGIEFTNAAGWSAVATTTGGGTTAPTTALEANFFYK